MNPIKIIPGINADINQAKQIREEIKQGMNDDMSNQLNDFLYAIDVAYQKYHNLDENNWDFKK